MRAPVLLLALILPVPVAASARPAWISGTFVYADLCTDPGSGGIAGRRVIVRRSPIGDGVTYEAASGRLGAPATAASLAIDDGTRAISFTVEGEAGPLRFRGTAAPNVLAGTVSDQGGERPLRLRRVLRSHEREVCRPVAAEPETTASRD